jgi:hypothetical protein
LVPIPPNDSCSLKNGYSFPSLTSVDLVPSIHRHTGTVLFRMLGYLCFKFRSDSTHYHYFGCGLSWRRILLSETAPSLLSKAVLLQSATPFRDHSHQHFSTSYSEFLYLPAPHQSAFRVRPWLTMSTDSFELRGDR